MSQKPTTTMKSYLTKENRQNALRLRGLPFNVTEDDILSFFKNYNIVF
jgi:RNA recognition motif-containing protein